METNNKYTAIKKLLPYLKLRETDELILVIVELIKELKKRGEIHLLETQNN